MMSFQDMKMLKHTNSREDLSISLKLTLSLVIIISVVVSIVQTLTYVNQSQRILTEMQQTSAEHLNQIANILSEPVWNLNKNYISRIGLAFAQNDFVHGISISDSWNTVLYEFDKKQKVTQTDLKTKGIEYNGDVIGTVEIRSNFEKYENERRIFLRTTLTILGISISVILVTTSMLLNYFLRQPLALLIDGITQITEGDYSFQTEKFKQKEFVKIAYQYNAMAQKVKSREDRLNTINLQLMQEISRHKKTGQELQYTNVLLKTVQDTSLDGILATDEKGNILTYNHRFRAMWGIPEEKLSQESDKIIFSAASKKVMNPVAFIDKVEDLNQNQNDKSHDEVLLTDGKTIERYSAPMFGSVGEYFGRVWYCRDITEQTQAREKINASLVEKELLLKEVYHRVKNNLQVISSLLYFQSQNVKDVNTVKLFKESEAQVKAMALVHEKLYQSDDLARIDYGDYIKTLVNHLRQVYAETAQKIVLKVTASDITLGIDIAIPCGLIINELVSNCFKHAFPLDAVLAAEQREIKIDMDDEGEDEYSLKVSDNGIGFPSDFDIGHTSSLGMQIVNTLVAQLDGTIRLCREPETLIEIRIKDSRYKKRI